MISSHVQFYSKPYFDYYFSFTFCDFFLALEIFLAVLNFVHDRMLTSSDAGKLYSQIRMIQNIKN